MSFFTKRTGSNQSKELEVVETVYGYWNYHLRQKGQKKTLCGRSDVMGCNLPLSSYNRIQLERGSFCEECENQRRD